MICVVWLAVSLAAQAASAPAEVDAPAETIAPEELAARPEARVVSSEPGPWRRSAIPVLLGASAALPLWAPTLALCGGASAIACMIYPLSAGDPTGRILNRERLWFTVWNLGCALGCLGWLVAMATSVGAGALAAAGGMVGAGARAFLVGSRGPRIVWRVLGVIGAGIGGILAIAPSLAAAAASALVVALMVNFRINPLGSAGRPIWWLWFNAMLVGSVGIGMSLLAVAAAIPPLGVLGGHLLLWNGAETVQVGHN